MELDYIDITIENIDENEIVSNTVKLSEESRNIWNAICKLVEDVYYKRV